LGVMIVGYIVVFVGFAVGLRNIVDGFHIKEELKWTAVIGLAAVVPWYIFNINDSEPKRINDNIFPFSTLALITAVAFAFFASTVWPLYRSIWQPPILEDLNIPDSVTTLRGILSTPLGVDSFKRFLTKEFSVENILFYLEVEDYRKKKIALMEEGSEAEQLQLVGEAQRIYSKYIGTDSPFQVNLPSLVVQELQNNLKKQFNSTKDSGADRGIGRVGTMSPKGSDASATIGAMPSLSGQSVLGDDGSTSSYLIPMVPTVFDPAQKNIFHLMETDSCPRYFRSELYKEFVNQVTEKKEKKKVLDEMNII